MRGIRLHPLMMAGVVLIIGGLAGIGLGLFLFSKAQGGLNALDKVYAAQDVKLAYDASGNLTDRGTTEGANKILAYLQNDLGYPLNRRNLDPNDPVINTPDELMYQYAVISYHVLNSTVKVTLTKDVEYKGQLYKAGTHDVPIGGKYWTDFDRQHPLEGPARELAWTGTAHGLLASLTGGVNADYQAGLAHFMAWAIFIGLGSMFTLAGVFVVWGAARLAQRAPVEPQTATHRIPEAMPRQQAAQA